VSKVTPHLALTCYRMVGMSPEEKIALDLALVLLIIVLVWAHGQRK